LVLPPLFPLLKAQLGIGFVELGFALTVANIMAVAAQLPVGSLVDRLGSRRMLVVALVVAGLAFVGFGLAPSYPHLLLMMVFVGVANSVFHPADYAILSANIAPDRLRRAFPVRTLAAYLTAQAFGVLAGGFVADRPRRHAEVAALGYGVNALVVLAIGTIGFDAAALLAAMACAGFLGGLIMPSRDMLVRAAAPPGMIGRTFGIVTAGFSISGIIGPLMFGWILDHGARPGVFGAR